MDLISLRLGSDGDDVEFVSDETWYSHSDASNTLDHTIARIFNESIVLYPTPTAGSSYTLQYIKKPTALSAGGDIPAIPEELHTKLVYYACARAKYVEGEDEKGDRWMAFYEDGLPPPSLASKRNMPGPLSLIPAPGVFDTSDSRHI